MTLKRKRSASELGSPCSTTSTISASSAVPFPYSSSPMANAPHLPSRTLKRARDSRPSDDEVHRRTLGLLYSAQRHRSVDAASPSPAGQSASDATSMMGVETQGGRTQRSLHSFWTIPSAPSSAVSAPDVGLDVATSCDDCGGDLPGIEEDAMNMGDGLSSACGLCGKNVCEHCSVTNVDGQRRCLQCSGRKVWVGGHGWAAAPRISVC